MSPTTQERLTTALHDAARGLRPPAGLAAAAIAQSRRTRRRAAAGVGAVVVATGVAAAVMLPVSTRGPDVVDGTLVEAPDWSGCAARLPLVNEDLGTIGVEPGEDAVEVAVCGPVVEGGGEVAMKVHVAGPADAQHIARQVLRSREGSLVEGCVYQVKCETTYFALRMEDGTVVRLGVTDLGRGALVADGSTSRVGAGRVLDAVQDVQATAPWHTYHADDTPPPPLAFGDFECPDDVPVEDWQTYLASPEPGERDVLSGSYDRVVLCAYPPEPTEEGTVRVQVGIGFADDEATQLVSLVETSPVLEETEDGYCRADTGLSYLLMVGTGDVLSHVLYVSTAGCRVAGEVTPDTSPDERLSQRRVTAELTADLLAAVGPENLQ